MSLVVVVVVAFAEGLTEMVLSIFRMRIFQYIVKETNVKKCNTNIGWVVPRKVMNSKTDWGNLGFLFRFEKFEI